MHKIEEERQNGLFAVFDGHSGDRAADYCVQHLSKKLIKSSKIIAD